jgi:hypothetical protein
MATTYLNVSSTRDLSADVTAIDFIQRQTAETARISSSRSGPAQRLTEGADATAIMKTAINRYGVIGRNT